MEKTDEKYKILRILAEALYDHQDIRIQSKNRVRCLIRNKLLELGFVPEKKKQEEDAQEPNWDDKELINLMKEALKKDKINKTDYDYLMDTFDLADKETTIEKEYENKLKPLIEQEPIWSEWLQYVNGISVRNTCRLLRYFGYCERFDTVAKLWAYSGLSVKDGHAIKRAKGEQLPYNLKIKTGVVGVIGSSLLKANKSYKKLIYDSYKNRILERGCCDNPKCKGKPGHAHSMAIRKMAKMFLSHYWLKCREIKGLPTREPYPIEKLKHSTFIKPFYDKKPDQV